MHGFEVCHKNTVDIAVMALLGWMAGLCGVEDGDALLRTFRENIWIDSLKELFRDAIIGPSFCRLVFDG
jgi:hypothetical protein